MCRPCAALAGLLQRAGRRPEDALCRREVQLPQLQLPQLLDACSTLLEQLLKVRRLLRSHSDGQTQRCRTVLS